VLLVLDCLGEVLLLYVLFTDVEFLPDGLSYYPVLYFNDYWNLNQDYMPINSTTK